MRIGTIQASSQADKNEMLFRAVQKYAADTETINFGCRAGESSRYSYIEISLMAGMLLAQITFNVGMCLFILPVMGLTLPFISYGGSSIITLFAAMGMISSIKAKALPSWLKDRNSIT